jgi:hypothetical protein
MNPEEQFAQRVLANIEEAETKTGYVFRGLRDMIDQHTAVKAAKMLVDISHMGRPYDGFQVLVAHDLEHLSVEQAIADFAESGLFTVREVRTAKARLIVTKEKKLRNAAKARD